MTSQRDSKERSLRSDAFANEEARFDEQLVRLTVVLAIDVAIVCFAAWLVPARSDSGWSVLLIPLATLAAFLPAALGAAAMWIRRSRFALAAGTAGGAMTMGVICCDLLELSGGPLLVFAVLIVMCQMGAGVRAKKLAQMNIFPKSLRLATFALLFKLAIVGILASAFVPVEKNPLRLLGWTTVAERPDQ